jgi:hypothetical protein
VKSPDNKELRTCNQTLKVLENARIVTATSVSPGAVSVEDDGVVLGDLDELAAAEVVLRCVLKGQPHLLRYHRAAGQDGNVLLRSGRLRRWRTARGAVGSRCECVERQQKRRSELLQESVARDKKKASKLGRLAGII